MQRIKLDINPKGEIPVLHVAQYDKGRLFEVELVDGEDGYNVPSGYSVQLNVRKTDSKLVTAAPTNVADNILTFATTEQMTACAGENIGSVTLKDADDYVITTLYFLISVQRDVLAGGLNSASEIHNLEEQIAAIVPEVIGDDYYNKTETDALLANKANMSDLAPLASKAELTQAILDEDIALKNWVSSNFATPGYVNERIFNMLPVGSASGNPCIFNTEIAAALQALTAKIVCGGGGGTPDNPIPLVGHSELNLTRCGVNLFDDAYVDNNLTAEQILPAGTYYIKAFVTGSSEENRRFSFYFNDTWNVISSEGTFDDGGITWSGSTFGWLYGDATATVTLTHAYKIRASVLVNTYLTRRYAIYVDNSISTFVNYNGTPFTVAFGQTVYGGVYDANRGKVTITHKCIAISKNWVWHKSNSYNGSFYIYGWENADINDLKSNTPFICSHLDSITNTSDYVYGKCFSDNALNLFIMVAGSSVQDLKDYIDAQAAANTPIQICYVLATPIVIDVPSISVFAENGTNNIISDCGGDVNVSYKDTIQHYIDTRV